MAKLFTHQIQMHLHAHPRLGLHPAINLKPSPRACLKPHQRQGMSPGQAVLCGQVDMTLTAEGTASQIMVCMNHSTQAQHKPEAQRKHSEILRRQGMLRCLLWKDSPISLSAIPCSRMEIRHKRLVRMRSRTQLPEQFPRAPSNLQGCGLCPIGLGQRLRVGVQMELPALLCLPFLFRPLLIFPHW